MLGWTLDYATAPVMLLDTVARKTKPAVGSPRVLVVDGTSTVAIPVTTNGMRSQGAKPLVLLPRANPSSSAEPPFLHHTRSVVLSP